jgi:hypothetical protein
MPTNFTFYASFFEADKWVSKTDFIYRLKVNCDCSDDEHARFLSFIYRLSFSRAKRTQSGGLVFY